MKLNYMVKAATTSYIAFSTCHNNASAFLQNCHRKRPASSVHNGCAVVPSLLAIKNNHNDDSLITKTAKRKENPDIIRNRKIIDLGSKKKWKEILLLYEMEGEDFNHIHFATTMHQLGKIRSFDCMLDQSFVTFLNDLINKLKLLGITWMGARGVAIIIHSVGKLQLLPSKTPNINMAATSTSLRTKMLVNMCVTNKENAKWLVCHGNSQDISNVAWSCAKLGIAEEESEAFFSEVENRSKSIVRNGNSQTIANTAWACAKLQINAPTFFSVVEQHSARIVKQANAQELANIAWAFATSSVKAPKLFHLIETRAEWFVKYAKTQEIANMAWAFATLGIVESSALSSQGLFAYIEKRSSWLIRNGQTQEIGNTAWAFGTLGIKSSALFSEIEKHSQRLVSSSNPQETANIAWACGTLQFKAPNFFEAVESRAKWLVREGTPQTIANTAWACAKVGNPLPTLFSELDSHAKWFVNEGYTQEIANTVWAGAKLRLDLPHLMDEVEVNAHWLISNGSAQAVSNIAWGCATLGIPSPNLFSEIDKRALWLVENGSDQDIKNTLWAISALNTTPAEKNNLLLELGQKQQQNKQQDKSANPAVLRNKKIIDLGRKKNWRGMLYIHETESQEFDHINYATVMNYLGFNLSIDYEDIAFNSFLDDLADQLERRGIEWMGGRGIANIISALGTMELKSPNSKRIALYISKEASAEWLAKNGTPEDVANTAWACATLGIFWR